MVISEKVKAYLTGAAMLVALILLIHFLGEIILPFIFALFIAHLIDPIIVKIQTKIPNRNVAITSFLTVAFALIVCIFFFFGSYFIRDTKRLVGAVDVFVEQHEDQINEVRESVSNFVDGIYESEVVQNEINSLDTMSNETKEKDITSALEQTYSLLTGSEKEVQVEKEEKGWNGFIMLIYTLIYLVTILYSFEYFQARYDKYIKGRKPMNSRLHSVWLNFTAVFLVYFRQRSKIVLISMAIFILAFTIMDLPGAIIIGMLTGLLTYAAHFHYLSLPVVAIGCWVLSVETDLHFLLFFGILVGVYALVSVLEETVFFNRIMKSVRGMNAAIIILAFSVWIYVLGGFVGTILALPLTQFILIYVERMLQYQKEQLDSSE
ncbi:MAG: AI-2E family transporter [Crocinitomicaceae bacterium]|nr:AI-2E family transporter [Crocinitomicaceae bacterium]